MFFLLGVWVKDRREGSVIVSNNRPTHIDLSITKLIVCFRIKKQRAERKERLRAKMAAKQEKNYGATVSETPVTPMRKSNGNRVAPNM